MTKLLEGNKVFYRGKIEQMELVYSGETGVRKVIIEGYKSTNDLTKIKKSLLFDHFA